jgi:hypothetical protein
MASNYLLSYFTFRLFYLLRPRREQISTTIILIKKSHDFSSSFDHPPVWALLVAGRGVAAPRVVGQPAGAERQTKNK